MTLNSKYNSKAQDSFKTKLTIYLFDRVINGALNKINQQDFADYQITQPVVDLYTTEFWQYPIDTLINGYTIKEIDEAMQQWKRDQEHFIGTLQQHYSEKLFPSQFPLSEFEALLQQDSCAYCKITIAQLEALADHKQIRKKTLRGWMLEIDRLDSNFEYTSNNCVMACYWCNNAKTDEFTGSEFKKIGEVISGIWKSRLEACGVLLNSE